MSTESVRVPKHQQPDYLDLLEKVLLYSFWPEPRINWDGTNIGGVITDAERESGMVAWPAYSFTMLNRLRLRNVRDLCERSVRENVPGAFVECGVWRGGACIYARACLPLDRMVHVCDSFVGFPKDEPEDHWPNYKCLSVSQDEVMSNFIKFGLLENVNFLSGYFKDSLAKLNCPIAVLRADADSYRSTTEILTHLWPKISPGGFLIMDDYNPLAKVKLAYEDYFKGSPPPVHDIEGTAAWCQKL